MNIQELNVLLELIGPVFYGIKASDELEGEKATFF